MRDCAVRDFALASSALNHGIGLLWQGADPRANISIKLETDRAQYELLLGFSSGQIEPYAGEVLYSKEENVLLMDRKIGSDKANYYNESEESPLVNLVQPEALALTRYRYVKEEAPPAAAEVDRLLRTMHFSRCRDADLPHLKLHGSASDYHTTLQNRCRNLWSVLRNLHGKQALDERYETIISFMRKSVPAFKDLVFEQTGPNSVYANSSEEGRRDLIPAFGVADGQIQMLILLTELFSEVKANESLILFDEPETSLHPYALSIFAQAVKHATEEWNRQVFIATHSPVLISQFEPEDILAAELDASGQTVVTRVSEMDEVKDLLEDYAAGSLYMAEVIAPQSRLRAKEGGE